MSEYLRGVELTSFRYCRSRTGQLAMWLNLLQASSRWRSKSNFHIASFLPCLTELRH